jgi:hypothetical protein
MPIKYVDGKKIHLPYPKKSKSTLRGSPVSLPTKSTRRVSTTRKKPTTRPAK